MGGGDGLVSLGKIVRPHGIRGEVRVFLFTERPHAFERSASVWIQKAEDEPEERSVERVRFAGSHAIVKFFGIDDRNASEALRGAFVALPEDALPPFPEGTYAVSDLVGLEVRTTNHEVVGTLVDVLHMPAHDVYVVDRDGRECLIPAVCEFVKRVAVEEGLIEIHVIEGLLE